MHVYAIERSDLHLTSDPTAKDCCTVGSFMSAGSQYIEWTLTYNAFKVCIWDQGCSLIILWELLDFMLTPTTCREIEKGLKLHPLECNRIYLLINWIAFINLGKYLRWINIFKSNIFFSNKAILMSIIKS